MSTSYDFTLTNGSSLGTVLPLEGNGPEAQSVPRQIIDTQFGASTPTFVLQGDISERFVVGFPFSVTGGTAYDGDYIVGPTDATVDSNGNTVIPTSSTDSGFGFDIVAVTDGVAGTITVVGVNNGSCIFYPTATFNVIQNGFSPANKSYTVQDSESSNQYNVTAVTPGVGGTWSTAGLNARFFIPGQRFQLAGGVETSNGIYTVQSAIEVDGSTVIQPVEAIPAQTTISGTLVLLSTVTIITINGAVPANMQLNGLAQSPVTQQFSLAAPTAITPTIPGMYFVSWRISGDWTEQILPGCSIAIKNNNFFAYQILEVVSTSVTNDITSVVTQIINSTSPVITQTGSLLFPAPPIPYGSISYNTPNPFTTLQLVGRGSPLYNSTTSWGEAVQSNQIHQLENFADDTEPNNPLVGQLWWNTTSPGQLNVRDTPITWKGIIVSTIPSSGIIDMNGHKIVNLADATAATDAMNMETSDSMYIAKIGGIAAGKNGIMTGDLTMDPGNINLSQDSTINVNGTGNINVLTGSVNVGSGGTSVQVTPTAITITSPTVGIPALNVGQTRIINVSTPEQAADAANKSYVDGLVNGVIWLQPMSDGNLFDDSLSGPLTGTSADPSDPLGGYFRSFIVKPTVFNVTARTAGLNGTLTIDTASSDIVINNLVEVPGDTTNYDIIGVSTGNLGSWVINGNNASTFAAGMTFIVANNSNTASNGVYSVASAEDSGATTIVHVTGNIPSLSTATGTVVVDSYVVSNISIVGSTSILAINGTVPATGGTQLLHASGEWNGKDGHIVAYNGTTWVSLLGRSVRAGDRVGVFMNPANGDPMTTLPGGSFVGKAGKILTVNLIDDLYNVTWTGSVPEYTPREPDAVSVLGTYSLHFGNSYTFRGTWGTGQYGSDYEWIEFQGPSIVGDGAGLKYTGAVLNVGEGAGIIVNPDNVQLDTSYTDSLYLRRDGSLPATGNINAGTHKVINLADPTLAQDAVTLNYANNQYMLATGAGNGLTYSGTVLNIGSGTGIIVNADNIQLDQTVTDDLYLRRDGTLAPTANLNIGSFKLTNVANPTVAQDAVTFGFADSRYVQLTNTTDYVTSFNTRPGAVVLTDTDVTTAIGGTPVLQSGNATLGVITGTSALTLNATSTNPVNINLSAGTGGVRFGNGAGTVVSSIDSAGNATFNTVSATNVTGTSDIRLKQEFEPITDALYKANQIETFIYEFQNNVGVRLAGVSAQSLQAQLPQAVSTDQNNHLSVSLQGEIALLFAALQELSDQVSDLKNQIQSM